MTPTKVHSLTKVSAVSEYRSCPRQMQTFPLAYIAPPWKLALTAHTPTRLVLLFAPRYSSQGMQSVGVHNAAHHTRPDSLGRAMFCIMAIEVQTAMICSLGLNLQDPETPTAVVGWRPDSPAPSEKSTLSAGVITPGARTLSLQSSPSGSHAVDSAAGLLPSTPRSIGDSAREPLSETLAVPCRQSATIHPIIFMSRLATLWVPAKAAACVSVLLLCRTATCETLSMPVSTFVLMPSAVCPGDMHAFSEDGIPVAASVRSSTDGGDTCAASPSGDVFAARQCWFHTCHALLCPLPFFASCWHRPALLQNIPC